MGSLSLASSYLLTFFTGVLPHHEHFLIEDAVLWTICTLGEQKLCRSFCLVHSPSDQENVLVFWVSLSFAGWQSSSKDVISMGKGKSGSIKDALKEALDEGYMVVTCCHHLHLRCQHHLFDGGHIYGVRYCRNHYNSRSIVRRCRRASGAVNRIPNFWLRLHRPLERKWSISIVETNYFMTKTRIWLTIFNFF